MINQGLKAKGLLRRILGDVNSERLKRVHARYQCTRGLWSSLACPPMQLASGIRYREYFVAGHETFFGYYDKLPESRCGERVLAGITTGVNSGRVNQGLLTLGFFQRGRPESFAPVAMTAAWCWQQGSMLQWFPSDSSSQIVFNDMHSNSFCASVVDVRTKQCVQKFCRPIYAVCPRARYALSCSFSRLHELRPGYGYPQIPDENRGVDAPASDGVWLLDLRNNTAELFCSLRDIARVEQLDSMIGSRHYINHLSFSPSGERFLFLHLWIGRGKQYSRMIVGSISGHWHILTNSYVSHYCWGGDEEIIVYSKEHPSQLAFNRYNWTTGFVQPCFSRTDLPDGHPTFSPGGTDLLTDTYPDRLGYQRLYLLDPQGCDRELGRFFHRSSLANDRRCDLHPRWNPSGERVYIDTACKGRRRLVELDLANVSREGAAD